MVEKKPDDSKFYSPPKVIVFTVEAKHVCNVKNEKIKFDSCRFCEDDSLSRHIPGLITPVRVSGKHGFEPTANNRRTFI